jgi:hypothetical protein
MSIWKWYIIKKLIIKRYYKDTKKVGDKINNFNLEGTKYLFGLMRSKFESTIIEIGCFVFFPTVDHKSDHFITELKKSFKTSNIMGKNKNNIHIFFTCNSIEEFDEKVKNLPSGINIWADINGKIADSFGMRPMIQKINAKSIINGEEKRNYEKQTISGLFFLIKGEIIKSPAFQPKLQEVDIENVKSGFSLLDKCNYDKKASIEKGIYKFLI